MAVFTVLSRNYPKEIEVTPDFPKCVCGGEFKVHDNYNKKGQYHGATADCIECGEHFCMDNYEDLQKRIPVAQKIRSEK